MESSLQEILATVRNRVRPSATERNFVSRLGEQLRGELKNLIAREGMTAEVSVQGSVARDTWIRGEHDIDLFARFPGNSDRRLWTDKFLPAVHRAFRRYRNVERYAEHPYVELWADHNVRVNIVPCYSVEKGQWKSATDRSPYHTEYMQNHLNPVLRDEARLLKRFAKGVRAYGAEIRVGGFSGMLVETLALWFQSFVKTLREAAEWKEHVFIDVEKHSSPSGFGSGFVVIDPVDPGRNLAAAVRPDVFWSFVAASRAFLEKPSVSFFFPPRARRRSRGEFMKCLTKRLNDIVVIHFSHPRIVQDILWGQLFSLERALVGLLERNEFHVIRSQGWSDEIQSSAVIMEIEQADLSRVLVRAGPPVSRSKESDDFLTRHSEARDTERGPWISQGRWVVEKKREATSIGALLKVALHDHRYGLSVPKQIETNFRKSVKILRNQDSLSLLKQPGFAEEYWEFLEGRPIWLKPARS